MITIRSEIEKNLSRSGHNLASFAKVSGVNRGSLSAILHGNPPKPISLGQLDAITRALGYPEGWFYPLYIDECFSENKVSRRRIEPFLVRCAEIGKKQCIDDTVARLWEYQKPLEILFAVAEKLYEYGKIAESTLFYRLVAENEPDGYAEHLAVSQYRIFKSLQSVVNNEEKLRAVITFEPFRNRLPEDLQLDGLLKLANVSFTLHKWRDVEKYADELRTLARAVYREETERMRAGGGRGAAPMSLPGGNPLVLYYGHGYLLKASALTKQGRYEEAKKFTAGYSDLSWFELLDDRGRSAVESFKLFAQANGYMLEIMTGNTDILSDYADFLAGHPGEILAGLITILDSANRYGFAADAVLSRFSREMQRFEDFQDPINLDRRLRLEYELAQYYIGRNQYEKGLDFTLQCLRLSVTINSGNYFIKCVTLFETNREHAARKQCERYKDQMKEVRHDEKGFGHDDRRFGVV